MSSENYNEKEGYVRIFIIIAIVLCLMFMTFSAYSAVRFKTQDGFGKNYYTNYNNKETVNGIELNNDEAYFLQNFTVNDKDNLRYKFCFGYNISETNGVKVDVINQEQDVLGTTYLFNNSYYACVDIDSTKVQTQNYMGVKCLTCDASNSLYLQEELSGNTAEYIYFDETYLFTSKDTTMNYLLIGEQDFQNTYRLFLFWFIILLIALSIGFVAIGGINQLYNYMYDEFGGKEK